jgi:hypothetical protein
LYNILQRISLQMEGYKEIHDACKNGNINQAKQLLKQKTNILGAANNQKHQNMYRIAAYIVAWYLTRNFKYKPQNRGYLFHS